MLALLKLYLALFIIYAEYGGKLASFIVPVNYMICIFCMEEIWLPSGSKFDVQPSMFKVGQAPLKIVTPAQAGVQYIISLF